MRLNGPALGLLVVAGGAALLVASLRLPGVPGQDYGAGFFPSILAVALVLAGLGLVIGGMSRHLDALVTPPPWMRDPHATANVALLVGIIALFAAAGDRIGFIPFAVGVLFALQWRLGIPPLRAAVIAVPGAVLFHLLFVIVLRVPLPPGLLERFL